MFLLMYWIPFALNINMSRMPVGQKPVHEDVQHAVQHVFLGDWGGMAWVTAAGLDS